MLFLLVFCIQGIVQNCMISLFSYMKIVGQAFFVNPGCRKNNGGSTPACRLYLANIKIEKRRDCLTGEDLHLRVTISTPEQNHQNTEHRRQIGNGHMRLPHSLV